MTTSAKQPTIILIPGLMNDGWVWHGVIGALSRLGPIHIARTDGCDSLAAMARSIAESVNGPMVVIGHSMGGGWRCWIRAPPVPGRKRQRVD